MRRTRSRNGPITLPWLTATGPGAPTLAEKVVAVRTLQAQDAAAADHLVSTLIDHATSLQGSVHECRTNLAELESALEKLTTPPLHPAIYLGSAMTGAVLGAVVVHGNTQRLVPVAEGVDADALRTGDEVLLSQDMSALVAASGIDLPACGETAVFERMLGADRILVRVHDDQLVVGLAEIVRDEVFEHGDLVRWDRPSRLAFEKIERAELDEFLIESVPDLPLSRVAGLDHILQGMITSLTIATSRPDLESAYDLGMQRMILLVGPPGCGKTLMVRVAAAEVQRQTGRSCRICSVKPGQFEDPYVGVTQRRIRECFEQARRCDGFVLVFFDEIDSIGRIRGGMANQHGDKFLAALLAEIQGFDAEENANIAIIATTNRLDLLDPALAERMETQYQVGRPDMDGARAIFSVHLGEGLPYSPNGSKAAVTRDEIIDRAVTEFYSPNADNEICTVRFTNAKERTVTARDLASGRCFEQVCRAARREAAYRELRGGEAGLRVEDIEAAIAETFGKLAATLTRRNIHSYLADLPEDQDVAAVEPATRRLGHASRYMRRGRWTR